MVLPPESHPSPTCWAAPTCRDEEDAGAEDDVVFALVELAGRHAQASKEQQTHAEDGEDAGRSHCTCGTRNGTGSVPSIASAAGAAGTSRTSTQKEVLQFHEGWGHPAPALESLTESYTKKGISTWPARSSASQMTVG